MTGNKDSKLFYIAVGNNIKKYRDIRNYSLQILGDKVGLTKKTIQRYESGEIKVDMNRLADISNALSIDVSQLLDGTEKFLGVSLGEFEKMIKLPIVGKISCGNGAIAYENIEGYESTPEEWVRGGEYFYLRAQGDSMENARINNGDLLLIREQDEVEDGEIAAVLINEETYLKRIFKRNGTLILQSENPNYPPMICDPKEGHNVRIIGKLKKVVIDY